MIIKNKCQYYKVKHFLIHHFYSYFYIWFIQCDFNLILLKISIKECLESNPDDLKMELTQYHVHLKTTEGKILIFLKLILHSISLMLTNIKDT